MGKRFYLAAGLVVVLGAGVVAARGDSAVQKERQKSKEKTEQQDLSTADQQNLWSTLALTSDTSYLGVFLEEVTSERAKELNLSEERGAVVMKVVTGGPAEKAGLKENDVIVSFNGRRVDSVRELTRLLGETPAGRNVSIEVIRGGGHQTLTATLSKREGLMGWRPELDEKWRQSTEEAMKRAQEQLKHSEDALKHYELNKEQIEKSFKDSQLNREQWEKSFRDGQLGNYFFVGPGEYGIFRGGRLGVNVESLTEQLAGYFGVKEGKGVLVTHVEEDSPAGKAGIKAGDVITAVDNEPVDGVRSLMTALRKKEQGQVVVKAVRNKHEQTFTVVVEKRQTLMRPLVPRRRAVAAAAAA
jgi:C-terminal processing protease CtpA/Prc